MAAAHDRPVERAMLRSLASFGDDMLTKDATRNAPILTGYVHKPGFQQTWAVARTNFATKVARLVPGNVGEAVHYQAEEIHISLDGKIVSRHLTVLTLSRTAPSAFGRPNLEWAYYDPNGMPPAHPKGEWPALKDALTDLLRKLYADFSVRCADVVPTGYNLALQSLSPGQYSLKSDQTLGWCAMYGASFLFQRSQLTRTPTLYYRLKLLLCDLNGINDRLMHANYNNNDAQHVPHELAAVYSVLPPEWGAGDVGVSESEVWSTPEASLGPRMHTLRAITCIRPEYTRYDGWEDAVSVDGVLVSLGWNTFRGCPPELPNLESGLLRALYHRVHTAARTYRGAKRWSYELTAENATRLARDACDLGRRLREEGVNTVDALLQSRTDARVVDILTSQNIALTINQLGPSLRGKPPVGEAHLLQYAFDVVYWTITELRNLRQELVAGFSEGRTPETRISTFDLALNYLFSDDRAAKRDAFCAGYLRQKYPDQVAKRASHAGYSIGKSIADAVESPTREFYTNSTVDPSFSLERPPTHSASATTLAHAFVEEDLRKVREPLHHWHDVARGRVVTMGIAVQAELQAAENRRVREDKVPPTVMAEGQFYSADEKHDASAVNAFYKEARPVCNVFGEIDTESPRYPMIGTVFGFAGADHYVTWTKTSELLPVCALTPNFGETHVALRQVAGQHRQIERFVPPVQCLLLRPDDSTVTCLVYHRQTRTLEPYTILKLAKTAIADAAAVFPGVTASRMTQPDFLALCKETHGTLANFTHVVL